HMDLIENLKQSIINGNEGEAMKLANEIIGNNIDLQEAILNGLSAGMRVVGEKYERHEYFLPEVIVAADALNSAFNLFKPHLGEDDSDFKAKIVIGVVKGDIHEIGKNIVSQFLTANNYKVIDLGRNVPPEKFITAVEENYADIVALSTLMSPTLDQMKIIIERLKEKGLRDQVKVIIGGAPTDEEFMKEIGADFCCKDANEAVSTLDAIIMKKKI
ncbi:MAG: cobalamin-binding protein, partial [Candidatus Lokiarchaeota archaeon]|nr:cobalamin-binding protein [Candidatus Lokiarchaeota archaeon]